MIYSYVVARDFGFAPNPFSGFCTLATCKPIIRKSAKVGDWVIGTGSAAHLMSGNLIFVMKISEAMTFDGYWNDARFQIKKPNLKSSKKFAFGDNIYHKKNAAWAQADSHHSLPDGNANQKNIKRDTQTDRVLVAEQFAYWGRSAPAIPAQFRNFHGEDICAGRGHKCHFGHQLEPKFVQWFLSRNVSGYLDEPLDW